jgi:hypothetical protein
MINIDGLQGTLQALLYTCPPGAVPTTCFTGILLPITAQSQTVSAASIPLISNVFSAPGFCTVPSPACGPNMSMLKWISFPFSNVPLAAGQLYMIALVLVSNTTNYNYFNCWFCATATYLPPQVAAVVTNSRQTFGSYATPGFPALNGQWSDYFGSCIPSNPACIASWRWDTAFDLYFSIYGGRR